MQGDIAEADQSDLGPYEEFRELVAHWNLAAVQSDLKSILDPLPEAERPAVPTRLMHAMHWFLESYGAELIDTDNCS